MFFDAMIEISLVTLVLAFVSQFIQNKFVDRDKMKAKQLEMKEKQKRMKELAGKSDQKSLKELEVLEGELLESMQEMMSGSTKVMVFSLLVFFPAFVLLGHFYSDVVISLPVPLPWFAEGFDLFNVSSWGIKFYSETNWLGWYFVSYLIITLLINFGRGLLNKSSVKSGLNG